MENLEQYLEAAKRAAHLAGDFLKKGYASFDPMFVKNGHEYYILADVECEKIYKEFLKKKTPEVDFFAEEAGGKISNLCWAVDPIDGTSNYRVGIPFFSTQIVLLEDGVPVVSVVHNPILNHEFTAIKDGGAFLNGRMIFCSEVEEIKKSLLIVAKGGSNRRAGEIITHFGDAVRTVRLYGATSVDLSYVAAGKFDITINYGSKLYDYAPGVLLMREAGGAVKNMKGEEWTIDDDNLVASNKCLMPQVLEILNSMK